MFLWLFSYKVECVLSTILPLFHLLIIPIWAIEHIWPNRVPSGAYFPALSLTFSPLGAWWGQICSMWTDYFSEFSSNFKKYYWSMLQYNRSKFCNMLHMTYLHSKLSDKGVSVNSVHPGNMVPTGIDRQWWFWKLVFILGRPFTKTITQGAATQLFCLVHPDAANISGSYFNQCCPCGPIPASINMTYAIELNTLSRNLVKDFLNWKWPSKLKRFKNIPYGLWTPIANKNCFMQYENSAFYLQKDGWTKRVKLNQY